MIEHRSAYTHPRIGLEFIAARQLIALDRIEQPKKSAAQEIFPIDVLRQTDGDASCDQPNKG